MRRKCSQDCDGPNRLNVYELQQCLSRLSHSTRRSFNVVDQCGSINVHVNGT
jgi:hypothetical protein